MRIDQEKDLLGIAYRVEDISTGKQPREQMRIIS